MTEHNQSLNQKLEKQLWPTPSMLESEGWNAGVKACIAIVKEHAPSEISSGTLNQTIACQHNATRVMTAEGAMNCPLCKMVFKKSDVITELHKQQQREIPVVDAPEWYNKQEIFDALIGMNYAPDSAEELSGWFADAMQKAFNKGWQKHKATERELVDEIAETQLIKERDEAQEAADEMAALILNEDINWSDHQAKWKEAIEELEFFHGKRNQIDGEVNNA